jgi:hypothetical protein
VFNKFIRTSLIAIITLGLNFAANTANAANAEKEWTFMLFMAADNNLEAATSLDINELEKYGSTDEVNFVAQIDRNGNYSQDSELKWRGARRFYIINDKNPKKMTSPAVQKLGDVDMAAPETLLDFVSWSVKNYPAKKYALILWNHGTGWKEINPSILEGDVGEIGLPSGGVPGAGINYNISYDDTSKTSMNIPTLGKTLAKIVNITGKPLEIMGFDACLMQMAEVSWTTRQYSKCQLGSPDLEPERGWPYDKIALAVTTNPKLDGIKLARKITELYAKSYNGGPSAQGNTAVAISVIDHSKSDDFHDALNGFCRAAVNNISDIDKYEFARDEALKYSYGDYVDLGHFLAILIQKTHANSTVKNAATRLLKTICGNSENGGYVNKLAINGDKFKESRGLSIFFPTRQGFKNFKTRYKIHDLAKDTLWYSFLEEVSNPNIPYLKLEDIIFEDKNKDGRIAAGEEVDVKVSIRNFGRKSMGKVTLGGFTNSKYIDNKKMEVVLSNLPVGGKSKVLPAFKINVVEGTPVNTEIKMGFTLKGTGIPVSQLKTSFVTKEQFSTEGHVLLVYTDSQGTSAPILEQMLKNAGIKFDVWDRFFDGDIRPEVLKRYLDGWVLISCSDSTPEQSLTDEEVDSIDQFLKSGGRCVLNGQDIAFCLRDNDFLKTRCKARFVQDDVNVHVVSGIKVCSGHSFQIFGGDGANNQKWPDEIDPLSGAEAIFKYEEGARDKADEREMNGPSHKPGSFSRGVTSSGAAAIRVVDGYRLMLFGFNIESVNSKSQRSEIMNFIKTFMQPSADDEIKNLAKASSRRVNRTRSVSSERVVVERADLLSCVEERLVKQIKEEFKKNPSYKTKVLQSFSSLNANERESISALEKKVKSILEFDKQNGTVEGR